MRLLIVNRWDDEFADYGRYVDHVRHDVAYVTVETHRPLIPAGTGHVEVVDDPDDDDAVVAAAQACAKAMGPFDSVLALSEFNLLTAARVREALSAPGPDVEATLLLRDKAPMKDAVRAAGLRVPEFRPVATAEDVAAFARDHGAVVVKPRTGAASVGCVVLPAGADPVRELAGRDLSGHEVEEYLDGPIWHVDGLISEGVPLFAVASRYTGTCYRFGLGEPLASVVHTGPAAERVTDFAVRCLHALGHLRGTFHLEVIEHPQGLAFLEVGARVGGGEIPFVMRDVYGVDLIGDWIRLELGEAPLTVPGPPIEEYAGFLMLPEPVGRRLDSRPVMTDRIPGLYAEVLPPEGHLFDGSGGYYHILGRFRYRGASSEAVEQAIEATLKGYTYVLRTPEGDN